MNKKKIICIIGIVIIAIIAAIIVLGLKETKEKNNETVKYRLITDLNQKTMRDDGGSHINQYYEIDSENMIITKYEDEYKGFEGYIYKRKKLYEKQLNESENEELNKLINKIIERKNEEKDLKKSNWHYYSLVVIDDLSIDYENIVELEKTGEKILVNDYELIESIENILKQ